jgi:type I restriction enzyme S subunit
LDTITDVRDGTHDSPQYVETGHPFITSKNVKDGFINYEDIQYVSDKDYEEINKRSKVDKNDILMGMIGTIGNIALVRETPDFAIKNVALIKDIGDVHYRYLYHCLQSNSVAHQLDENLDGGTQKFIALNKIRELVIPVPSEHEQHKIGDYMESLDNLITLHQRNSADFVSRFFSDFTNTWEQRKLGEVGKARSGVGFPDTEQGGTIGVPFFKVSDMNSDGNENEMTVANNYVTAEQIAAHRWSPIEELPAIFFAKVGAAVMLNRKRLCRFPFLLDNNTMAYSLSSTEWDADFAKALFETIDLTSLVQVGALPSYNAGDVEAMAISMPSLSEQGQIGEFFKQLDNLITLHQCEYIFKKYKKRCDCTSTTQLILLNHQGDRSNDLFHRRFFSVRGYLFPK